MGRSTGVCYLLLHLGVPCGRFPPPPRTDPQVMRGAEAAAQQLGIEVWPIRLVWGEYAHTSGLRYLFRFRQWGRDSIRATYIAESVMYAVSMVCGPAIPIDDPWLVHPVPRELARNRDTLRLEQHMAGRLALDSDEVGFDFPSIVLTKAVYLSRPVVDAAWRITPILARDESLHRAAGFLKASQDEFFVWPGALPDAIGHEADTARSGVEQTSFERALQEAFKAVEAVLGDPPSDDRKLFEKIQGIGLDPEERAGYKDKRPLHQVIRDMNAARDKKAAHGSTTGRDITVGELLCYQSCARVVVRAVVEKELGGSIDEEQHL